MPSNSWTFGPGGVYTATWDGVSTLTVTLTAGGAVQATFAPLATLSAARSAADGFVSQGEGGPAAPLVLQSTGVLPVFGAGTPGDAFPRVQLGADGAVRFGTGAVAPDTAISRNANGVLNMPQSKFTSFVDITTAGFGLKVAEGANCKQGLATLVAGTVTVANTSVTANSRIFLSVQVAGGTLGIHSIGTVIAGTSFVINSSNAADTSVIAYEIFEPG